MFAFSADGVEAIDILSAGIVENAWLGCGNVVAELPVSISRN